MLAGQDQNIGPLPLKLELFLVHTASIIKLLNLSEQNAKP
jgi:hypothetical protein